MKWDSSSTSKGARGREGGEPRGEEEEGSCETEGDEGEEGNGGAFLVSCQSPNKSLSALIARQCKSMGWTDVCSSL